MADEKTDSKSGICSPAGYNGKEPKSLEAPVKSYPGSGKIGHASMGKSIEGPASDAPYNKKRG